MHRLLITATLAFATLGSTVVAQQTQPNASDAQTASGFGHHHHAQDPHRMAMKMSKRLQLSSDQTARLEPILAARKQKVDALRADQSLTPEARRAQLHTIHEETKQQLAGLLTPDQLAQMKAMHHEHRHHGSEPSQPVNGPAV